MQRYILKTIIRLPTTMNLELCCPVRFEMIKTIFRMDKIEERAFSFIET